MPDKTLEELKQTEGGMLAAGLRAQNRKLKLIFAGLIFLCLLYAAWLLSHHMVWQSWPYIILSYALIFMMKSCMLRVHEPLNRDCDPYLAQEAYAYYYVKGKIEKRPRSREIYVILFAKCKALQGDTENALKLLCGVDRKRLTGSWLCVYYEVRRICCIIQNDAAIKGSGGIPDFHGALLQLRGELDGEISGRTAGAKVKRTLERELERIDLYLSIERGSLEVYHVLSGKRRWRKGTELQRVINRYTDAKACVMQNDLKGAREHCRYIAEHGGRLVFVELARRMQPG